MVRACDSVTVRMSGLRRVRVSCELCTGLCAIFSWSVLAPARSLLFVRVRSVSVVLRCVSVECVGLGRGVTPLQAWKRYIQLTRAC